MGERPLSHIRVLDFGQYLAGPLVGMPQGPAPKYGAHSREILAWLGYDDVRIDTMIASGVTAEAWSDKYLPE